jgi:predicted metal-binding protein
MCHTIKTGILTCSNTTRVLDCPLGACLKDLYERKGAFKEYGNKRIELVGINSCHGCPTVVGESSILSKIESLKHYGATHIHISYCVLVLCPFVKRYIKVIKDKFPDLNLIQGTHQPHQSREKFKCDIKNMLKDKRKTVIP